jgi:glycosyltransferase involved in cell wall biosynthesis
MPEVSVVIPTYNSARHLEQAVGSVLAQTFQDLEVMVVDDGSTDDTAAVIGALGPPVRYLHQPNSGVSAARNRGVSESIGRYVAFLDADDAWLPQKLAKQLGALRAAALRAAPGCRLCYTAFVAADSDLNPTEVRHPEMRDGALESLLMHGNVVGAGGSTMLCERGLFREAGGFDPTLSQCADWDMWIRLAALTEFLYLDEPLATYRMHGVSMSSDPRLLEEDSLCVLEKGFGMPGIEPALAAQRRRAFARNYMVLAGTYFQAGGYRDFARCAARSLSLDPRRARYLAGFPLRVARRRFNRGRSRE